MSAKKPESLQETLDGRIPAENPHAGARATASEVSIGEIIAGKFRVERILGQGGMGVVVLATHLVLEEQFALKLLRPEIAADAEIVERFSREAKACVRIKSEHVARVHDVGRREDGTPFMVMEYLEGIDLGTALHEQGPLPFEEAVEYVVQACEALAQAHAIGIVHRDIKPENLFMVNNMESWRSIKLLDFGISKVIPAPRSQDPSSVRNVRETRMMGTPHYMSPEQMQQLESIDGRSDIWSLGVVLYELLTAHYAWDGASVQEVTQAILKGKPPWLETVRPDAPPGLAQVIDRCLEKDPEQRYRNVAELAIALLPFAPRRARVSAERSVSVIRAAGLSSPDFKVPTSISAIPLSSTGPAVSLPASSFPAMSRDAGFAGFAGPREAPTMPDLSAELGRRAAVEKRTRALLTVAAGAGILASGLAIGLVTLRHRGPAHTAERPAAHMFSATTDVARTSSAGVDVVRAEPAPAMVSASVTSGASEKAGAKSGITDASLDGRADAAGAKHPARARPHAASKAAADGGEPDLGY